MRRERIHLSGRFQRRNQAFLEEKAARDDNRAVFYRAMLETDRYEAYLARVGSLGVEVKGLKSNPFTGRMEILYARHRGWIADAE